MSYVTDVELKVSGADLYDYKVKVSPDVSLELQYTEFSGTQENTNVISFGNYDEMERVAKAMLKACEIVKEMNS